MNYPCGQREYSATVGEVGQAFYQAMLQKILHPFSPSAAVFSCPTQGNGQDLTILDKNNKILAKFEVLNWHVNSRMDFDRALRIKENLKGVRFKAILGTIPLRNEPWHNISYSAWKLLRGIPKFFAGFQILPADYYSFFKIKNPESTLFRAFVTKQVFKQIKEPLKLFLAELNLVPLVYIASSSCVEKKSQYKDYFVSGPCEYCFYNSTF